MWCCFLIFFFQEKVFFWCELLAGDYHFLSATLQTGTTGLGVWAVTDLYLLCLGYQGCAELRQCKTRGQVHPQPSSSNVRSCQFHFTYKALGVCNLGMCQVRRLAKTRRGSVSRWELFPAPSALAIVPRPFWKRLFSSPHEEVGRAGFHKNSTFLMTFLLPFRLKPMRRDKLFQAVWRAHNAWPFFHEVRLEEVTDNPTMGMADQIQPASGVSPGASTRSQQCAQSPAWCLCAWLVIHTHIHGCRLKPCPGEKQHKLNLLQMVQAGRALPCCVFG